jgi:dolichol kinase
MGCLIAGLYLAGVSRGTGVLLLSLALAANLTVETLRLRRPKLNELMMRFWGPLMRRCEATRYTGAPYYLAASILAIGIFPKPIALLSILYLACGDPIASLFGVLYGDKGPRFRNGKSWVGTGAGILTCMVVSLIFLRGMSLPDSLVLPLTLIGGVAGGTAELLPLEVDDNLSIPIVSGFALWLGFILLGV